MHYISGVCKNGISLSIYTCIHKGFETIIGRCFQHLPVKSAIFKNKTNACAFCFCLGFPRPFVSDTSPKRIHREGLGESRTGTRQHYTHAKKSKPLGMFLSVAICFHHDHLQLKIINTWTGKPLRNDRSKLNH